MSEPWNFTEAQRQQFREAQIKAKRSGAPEHITGYDDPEPTLAERITAILEGTGFRPYSEMPPEATHHSGPFFQVTEGVGVTVSVAWVDATDAERGFRLSQMEGRLHEIRDLNVERRDGYLYVGEAEDEECE